MEEQFIREVISLKEGHLDRSLRQICLKNGYKNSFAQVLKQCLIVHGLATKSPEGVVLLSKELNATFLKKWVPRITTLSRTHSDEKVIRLNKKVESLISWTRLESIELEGSDKKEIHFLLKVLFRFGKIKKRVVIENKKKIVEYCRRSSQKDYETEVGTGSRNSEKEAKLLKVLTRLASFGESGTRLCITQFLKENEAPYYTKLGKILLDNNLVLSSNRSGVTRISWNTGRLKIPNLALCKTLLEKGNQMNNINSESKTTTKEVIGIPINTQPLNTEILIDISQNKETVEVEKTLLLELIYSSIQCNSVSKPQVVRFLKENEEVKEGIKDLLFSLFIQ